MSMMSAKKLLMIPGPTPVVRSIQNEMGRETIAFGDPAFVGDFSHVVNDLKTLWKTSGEVFVVAGSGTLAMEMAIANSTKRGDPVLVVSHGYFGDRFVEIGQRKQLQVDVLASPWGSIVPLEKIESQLKSKPYQAVTVTHVDTSTAVCAPVEEISRLVRKHSDACYIVDGVAATGAEREYVDEMNIDILFTASQKAFGVPPGLAVLWAGEKALARKKQLGLIPEYYVDFDKWLPIMHDPSKYFATPPVNLIWALQEALRIISAEGLEVRYQRHLRNARAIHCAMESLGMRILAEAAHRAVTLSGVLYPEGIQDIQFRNTLAAEGVQVAGGLGQYAGKMFRLGHMGNIDDHTLVSAVAAIERTLSKLGVLPEIGRGVSAVMKSIESKN